MDVILTGYSDKTGKSVNVSVNGIVKLAKSNVNITTSDPNIKGNSTEIIESDTYAYSIENVQSGQMKTILFMIGLPEDFSSLFAGRVYMLTITLRIFKSELSTTIPPPNDVIDPQIGTYTIQYLFDTTWTDRLKPNGFVLVQPNIYYQYNSYIPNLDIYFDTIFDKRDNNITLVIRTQNNQYYVIASDVVIDSVYPKITTAGDFNVASRSYTIQNSGGQLTQQQIQAIADYSNQILYPSN